LDGEALMEFVVPDGQLAVVAVVVAVAVAGVTAALPGRRAPGSTSSAS
jgi:hypothetical protein